MNINSLVFSNNPSWRWSRHVCFWSLWILYDTIFVTLSWPKYPFAKAVVPAFLVELFSFPMDMAFCYSIIYFVIPRFLYKGMYLQMIAAWLGLSLIYIVCYRVYSDKVPAILYASFGMPYRMHSASFLWDFFYLFSQINMEGCMAAAIRLGKMWYIKQRESEIFLDREKKQEQLTVQGSIYRPQPAFLLRALEKTEQYARVKPEAIPGTMQKIRELYSYTMYANNWPEVSLAKELEMLKVYVELEKLGSSDGIKVSLELPDLTAEKKIAPLIILSIAENSFRHLSLSGPGPKTIDITASLLESNFEMDISWSKQDDTSALTNDWG
jgi:hypothetical protein